MCSYSWDQLGSIDLPEMLEYVMSHTGQEDILYVGHSMGTTTLMVMANTRPDMMKHIKLANLFAPIAYVGHMISPLRLIAPFGNQIKVRTDIYIASTHEKGHHEKNVLYFIIFFWKFFLIP